MAVNTAATKSELSRSWRGLVQKYENPDMRRSMWQIANSIVPYFVLWYVAYRLMAISYWLTLPVCILAGGFLMRSFIIFHDCGHGSFFKSQRLNHFWGTATGLMTFTPYYQWRHEHAIHHATSGDLDRRGVGDVWTMTVKEYQEAPLFKKAVYSVFRNPFFMLVFGPIFMFVIMHRFVNPRFGKRETFSVIFTDAVFAATLAVAAMTIGIIPWVMVMLPTLMVAGTTGIWMFFVQHQYEGTYWERHDNWDYLTAALKGSSFYKLPKIIQWFSGNIGIHHIHHLSPKIPNYNLQACHDENELFQIEPVTFATSLKSLAFRFWDEDEHKMVWYNALWRRGKTAHATVGAD
jgi:omega-6 fatty acid desaturase (delta-12 desaturase)